MEEGIIMVVIVISGQIGAGSSTVARIIAERLGLELFTPGKYSKAFSKKGNEDERAISFWKVDEHKTDDFQKSTDEMQKKAAEHGNVVIDSKLGVAVIEKADLRVYMKADKNIRIKRVSGRNDISEKEAEDKIDERYEIEDKIWGKLYNLPKDSIEAKADLVIDTSDKTPEEIADIIIKRL